jgi:hypothetical protein
MHRRRGAVDACVPPPLARVQKQHHLCMKRCIPSASSKLSGSEESCLKRCSGAFEEAVTMSSQVRRGRGQQGVRAAA